jgi:hypothetical protein
MPGRILNFSEFFDKYSKDSGDSEKTIDSFTQAASNFEAGFDDETYDQTQLGPNKPVTSGSDATPAMPGEAGAPQFSSTPDSEMSAPDEEKNETEEQEENETPEEQETEENDETPEPEAGANPEEEKEVSESIKVKGFAQFIAESDWGPDYLQDDDYWSGDDSSNGELDDPTCPTCGESQWTSDFEDENEEGTCQDCGAPYDEYGATCGCNM